MIKLTKRKGFNFFRSYYDVFNELEDADKLAFIKALLDKQFLGINPTDLKGLAKFAWISQTNSIDSQVKGYEDKTGVKLTPTVGGSDTPTEQVEEKGEVQVEEKEQLKEKFLKWGIDSKLDLDKVEDTFLNAWDYYEDLNWQNKNGKPITNLQSTIRKVWFKDLSKFKKEIKIDKTVLMAAQQIPAQMQSLMDKHKVSELYLRDLYASKR